MNHNKWFKCPVIGEFEEKLTYITNKFGWYGRSIVYHVLITLGGRESGVVHFSRQPGISLDKTYSILTAMVEQGLLRGCEDLGKGSFKPTIAKPLIYNEVTSQIRLDQIRSEQTPIRSDQTEGMPDGIKADDMTDGGFDKKKKQDKKDEPSCLHDHVLNEERRSLFERTYKAEFYEVLKIFCEEPKDQLIELWLRIFERDLQSLTRGQVCLRKMTSGFRSKALNNAIGGSLTSDHVLWLAVGFMPNTAP